MKGWMVAVFAILVLGAVVFFGFAWAVLHMGDPSWTLGGTLQGAHPGEPVDVWLECGGRRQVVDLRIDGGSFRLSSVGDLPGECVVAASTPSGLHGRAALDSECSDASFKCGKEDCGSATGLIIQLLQPDLPSP